MANRRMFSLKIIDTDLFLDMPITARLLYYDLAMRADDDGFVASPKKIQRMIGCSDDDLKLLMAKQFIIPFESGVCVIRHWRIHNYIRGDRYTETIYKDEKEQLTEKDNVYEINNQNVIPTVDHMSYQMDTQVRLGKVRLGKDNKNIVHSNALIEQNQSEKDQLKQQIEDIWKLYPLKKGKSNAIKKIPKLLKKYGLEQIQRCIERYTQYVKHRQQTDFRDLKFQNGSTFFNGTYEDYLDENWKEGSNGHSSNDKADEGKVEYDFSRFGG